MLFATSLQGTLPLSVVKTTEAIPEEEFAIPPTSGSVTLTLTLKSPPFEY